LPHYAEALGVLLAHELVRLNGGAMSALARGGLTGLQQKRVTDFIEEHVARDVKLSELAALVELSPYHFARAFKQSFGVPPHRYHTGRRIERAKEMLSTRSVTEVALAVGFAETSSFSAAFRKTTGLTPTEFRRGAG
jgi:AraC family transcriptional regulator